MMGPWLSVVAILAVAAGAPAARQTNPVLEEFSAVLSNISNVGGTGLTPLTIRIRRWTGEEENQRMLAVLRDKGQRAFLDELLDAKAVGSISTPTSLKYDFFYASQTPNAEGGRRILLISDRPMTVSERASAATSREYPFTVIDLQLDKDGNGEGTLLQQVQLRLLGNILGVDNLASGPMQLNRVQKIK
ncbi:hypothetical protein BH24ACI5_BH24ACI5_25320 [soil metagenome]